MQAAAWADGVAPADAPPDMVASLVVSAQGARRVCLTLAPRPRWHTLYGRVMIPLGLPGAALSAATSAGPHVDPFAAALALGRRVFGPAIDPLPGQWTYGPSARHAIDRSPATEAHAPFLRLARLLAPDTDAPQPPSPLIIAVYRARLARDAHAAISTEVARGALWCPVGALRALVRGAAVGDALALPGVSLTLAEGEPPPDDALLYLPSDYGERHLLRIAAKYGEGALFAPKTP